MGEGRHARALCGAALLTLLACNGRVHYAPAAINGRWVSDDARFAGRTLEIGPHVVRFIDGHSELDAIVVRSVKVEGEPGTPQRFVIAGTARDGSATELALDLRTTPVEQLRLETQQVPWHRASAAPGENAL